MTYEHHVFFYANLYKDGVLPSRNETLSHVPLGEAIDLRSNEACGHGKISEKTFQTIREFRAKMAEYDKQWGRG